MSDIEQYLNPGDGVLDLGANVGSYARRYANKVTTTGFVLAVEADPDTARKAQQECRDFPQINVLCGAVGASAGTATLYRDKDAKRNSLWHPNVLDDAQDPISVETNTLDVYASIVDARRPLKAIKVDIQGAEMEMLKGGAETLQRKDLVWTVELWPMGLSNAGSDIHAVMDIFESHGWIPISNDSWKEVRAHAPNHGGHSAADVILKHKDAA